MVLVSRICLALCLFALCACQITLPDLSATSRSSPVLFSQSGIVLRAPTGYCADTKSLRDTPETGFALMANCKALKGRRLSPKDPILAVLTASISAPLSQDAVVDPAVLKTFFLPQTRGAPHYRGQGRQAMSQCWKRSPRGMPITSTPLTVLPIRSGICLPNTGAP